MHLPNIFISIFTNLRNWFCDFVNDFTNCYHSVFIQTELSTRTFSNPRSKFSLPGYLRLRLCKKIVDMCKMHQIYSLSHWSIVNPTKPRATENFFLQVFCSKTLDCIIICPSNYLWTDCSQLMSDFTWCFQQPSVSKSWLFVNVQQTETWLHEFICESKPTQAGKGIIPSAGHNCYLVICRSQDTVHPVGIKNARNVLSF